MSEPDVRRPERDDAGRGDRDTDPPVVVSHEGHDDDIVVGSFDDPPVVAGERDSSHAIVGRSTDDVDLGDPARLDDLDRDDHENRDDRGDGGPGGRPGDGDASDAGFGAGAPAPDGTKSPGERPDDVVPTPDATKSPGERPEGPVPDHEYDHGAHRPVDDDPMIDEPYEDRRDEAYVEPGRHPDDGSHDRPDDLPEG